jgi:hypothetical protein
MPDNEVDIVPLFFLHRHEKKHEIRAHGKICGVVAHDECVEVVARAAWLQGLSDETQNVAAQRVHLRVELDAADAVAQIDQRRPCIFLHHAIGLFRNHDRPDTV